MYSGKFLFYKKNYTIFSSNIETVKIKFKKGFHNCTINNFTSLKKFQANPLVIYRIVVWPASYIFKTDYPEVL